MYNLVLGDTIEGKVFLPLEDKLSEIARTLGKIDEQGHVAEDLRSQVLGQLTERLNYDRLYQEALCDTIPSSSGPGELEAALSNSREARRAVFDLFQDLDDYKPLSDVTRTLMRRARFLAAAVVEKGQSLRRVDESMLVRLVPMRSVSRALA